MKRLLLTLTFVLFILQASAADADVTSISDAFVKGNVSLLENVLDTNIDIAIPQKSGKYTQQETAALMKEFFQQNQVSSFKVVHKADKNGKGFLVGKYFTDSKEFRVNITYTIKPENIYIQSIRIE